MLFLGAGFPLAAQEVKPDPPVKNRRQLMKENQEMAARLDSMSRLLKEYEEKVRVSDSIAGEMIEIFEENEGRHDGPVGGTYSPQVTDSLLGLWYHHRRVSGNTEGNQYNMDSVHFISDVPDKVFLDRLAKMNSYITLPFNETVRNYIILYAEKMPTKMAGMLALASYYFPIFEDVFNRYEMPQELKYMAVIESAFNPVAVSRAGAKGMWQFMYNTARSYGLRINSFVDERLDPYKSADAAARYLKDAYSIFGDWNLAISSYNCGSGNVNKAIRRAGGYRDFWSIYEYLPRETRGYVPAFVGAMYAFNYYKEHGIVPDPVHMPAHVDTFEIRKNLHFQQISDLTGIEMDHLRELNPQYINDIIPGNEDVYILRLPYQYTGTFIEHEDSMYTHRAGELFAKATLENIQASGSASTTVQTKIVYKVKKGDYLGRIASRHHVTVAQIRSWNHLRSNNLRVGQKLVIYKKTKVPAKPAATPAPAPKPAPAQPAAQQADTASKGASPDTLTAKPDSTAARTRVEQVEGTPAAPQKEAAAAQDDIIYVVKKGDTLFKIAQHYPGITPNDIMEHNRITSHIQPGMKLKIPRK